MNDRRVLTTAPNEETAKKRLKGYQSNPTAKVEQVKGQWAVTAARVKKGAQQ
jgi:hypothetical protein